MVEILAIFCVAYTVIDIGECLFTHLPEWMAR